MKKFFSVILCVTCVLTLFAQTPDGLTCETAIPVDKSYQGSIDAPGVYYYTAWTYDLPLTCYFYPTSGDIESLYMDIDFTCNPGVYDDPNIAELADASFDLGMGLPMRFDEFALGYDSLGRKYYSLTVPESCREIMANFGITYNVQAFIKVNATGITGNLSLAPDTTFRSCIENSTWLNMPDTVQTGLLLNDRVYVLPLSDWRNDSIRFVWSGIKAPVQVWLGETCDFELKTTGDDCALFYHQLEPNVGENEWKLSKDMLEELISSLEKGGIYYARFVSSENASVVIEKQPLSLEMQNAVQLKLDKAADVMANDGEQVYFFDKEWCDSNVKFISSNKRNVKAYFAKSVVFNAENKDPNVLAIVDFIIKDNVMQLGLTSTEMSKMFSTLKGDHVFVKFLAESSCSITPTIWSVGDCAKKSTEIYPTDSIYLPAPNTSTSWRIDQDLWSKYDVKIYWSSLANNKIYLADTCTGFGLSPSNPHVVLYHEFKVATNGKTDTLVITSEQMKAFASRADADGYLYFRCNIRRYGSLTTTSVLVDSSYIQPEEPVLPSSPCVEASLLINSGDQLTLNLDSAFTIYRIEYAAWKDQGMSLSWTGTTDLHTFVAETCTFAVAPYNKYVHVYVPVQGEHTLDANAMADLAEYVDEDGYLYIRFLTEKEGVLTVK